MIRGPAVALVSCLVDTQLQARPTGDRPLTHDECIAFLGEWEGYSVVACERQEIVSPYKAARTQVWITLMPRPDRLKRCNGCGEAVDAVHDVYERHIRDLPILDAETWLVVPRCRLNCSRCGHKLE